jgi:hypothetical protein
MGVAKHQLNRDVFVDYDLDEMMVRYEHATGRFFCKMHGRSQEVEVRYDDRLMNDALRFGDEIDAQTYQAGKPRL